MSSVDRFYVIISILAVLLGGITWTLTRLFKAGKTYQSGLDTMEHATKAIVDLGDDLKELVRQKEREHDRLEREIVDTRERIGRHEEWHFQAGRYGPEPPGRS